MCIISKNNYNPNPIPNSFTPNRDGLNDVPDVTAISLTEVMKAVKFSSNQSTTLDNLLDLVGLEEGVRRFLEWALPRYRTEDD